MAGILDKIGTSVSAAAQKAKSNQLSKKQSKSTAQAATPVASSYVSDDYYSYSLPLSVASSGADYDDAEVTDRERQAAQNQTGISRQNVRDVQNQLSRQLSNFDFADAQNRALADAQLKQNSRKNSADRFEAQRALQQSALGLLGSMGSAMNGSTTGNLMRMLESRNDSDNNTFWAQHQANQESVENAYQDSLNQNNVARRDAMQSAEKAIRDIEGDWRAYMNNINPELYPGETGAVAGQADLGSNLAWDPSKAAMNNAQISGYVIPDNRGVGTTTSGTPLPSQSMNTGATRNRLRGTDYFSQMMNRFNGR
jgi:HEPN domain-containing protein